MTEGRGKANVLATIQPTRQALSDPRGSTLGYRTRGGAGALLDPAHTSPTPLSLTPINKWVGFVQRTGQALRTTTPQTQRTPDTADSDTHAPEIHRRCRNLLDKAPHYGPRN